MDELNDELLNKNSNKLEHKTPTSIAAEAAFAQTESDNKTTNRLSRHFSSREVKLIVFWFGIRLLCTGLIWDHYVHKYHDLLMVFSNNPVTN